MFIALAHLLPLIAIAVAQNASDSADTNATSATPSRTAEETPTTSYTGLPPSLRVNTAPLPSLTDGPYVSIPGPTPYTATVPAWGAFWSYSQPPIPSTTVTSDPAVFTAALGDEVSIAQPPQVREYNFTIDYAAGWPSGFLRRMIVVNNQFPGPLIEANQGDEIVVHVQNNLPTGQSIHWHGMRQNGTSVMDGVAGFSQCPIPPGGNYTYRFKTDGEFGTYWYHSHFGNTLSDGLLGALIIHSKDDPLKKGRDFDDDRIVYLSDWMNDDSTVIIENQSDMEKPYRGIRFVAEPDAVLINGNGQSDCDKAQRGVPCGENAVTEIKAAQGSQVRLRLINHGGQAQIRFSIDGHWLRVIEADDTPVESVWLKEISVGAGQRYSVVVKLDQGEVGSSFWIRAKVATWCMNPLATVDGVGILRYTDQQGEHAGVDEPCSTPWPDLADPHTAVCRDLDQDYPLVPLIKEDAPSDARESVVLDNLFGVFANPTTQKQMIGEPRFTSAD